MISRAGLHGVPMSVRTFTELPGRGNAGSGCLTEDLLGQFVYDADVGAWLPREYFVFEWDIERDGGGIGTVTLRQTLPANIIVLDGFFDVVEALVGEGASIAIVDGQAHTILSSEAIATAGTEGLHALTVAGTAATAFKNSAAASILLNISDVALTAGRLVGYLRCMRGFSTDNRSSESSSS